MPAVLVRAVCSRTSAAASPDGAKKSLAKSASQPAVGQLQRVGRLTRGPSPRRAWERRRAHVGHRGTGERLGAADGAASGVAGSGASTTQCEREGPAAPPAAAASRRPQPSPPRPAAQPLTFARASYARSRGRPQRPSRRSRISTRRNSSGGASSSRTGARGPSRWLGTPHACAGTFTTWSHRSGRGCPSRRRPASSVVMAF